MGVGKALRAQKGSRGCRSEGAMGHEHLQELAPGLRGLYRHQKAPVTDDKSPCQMAGHSNSSLKTSPIQVSVFTWIQSEALDKRLKKKRVNFTVKIHIREGMEKGH